MADYDKTVRRILSQNGCYLTRQGKGSHEIWFSPAANRPISVSSKIKSRHTANAILKEAGIKQKI